MKKIFFFLVFCSLLFSCKKQVKKVDSNKKMVMYQSSEMAQLMNTMYAKNQQIKKQLIAGKKLDDFPKEYLKIHTAILTDSTDRNPVFESFSKAYIKNMQEVFTVDKKLRINQFNAAINSCIACHQTSCTGPIPRIKKLLIP